MRSTETIIFCTQAPRSLHFGVCPVCARAHQTHPDNEPAEQSCGSAHTVSWENGLSTCLIEGLEKVRNDARMSFSIGRRVGREPKHADALSPAALEHGAAPAGDDTCSSAELRRRRNPLSGRKGTRRLGLNGIAAHHSGNDQ